MVRRRREFKKAESLCWTCVNSVPRLEEKRGCEWSILFQDVPGWDAKRTGTSVKVRSCPKYKKEVGRGHIKNVGGSRR